LQRIAQIDRGHPRVARLDCFVEIELCALRQPKGGPYNAEQRQKSDEEQSSCGLDKEAVGDRHCFRIHA